MMLLLFLTLRTVYSQTLRDTQAFLQSLFELMDLSHLPIPDYSTLCRRAKRLEIDLASKAANGALHLVVDSTGCKVFGGGEWKVRKQGWSKRRTWRTLHLGLMRVAAIPPRKNARISRHGNSREEPLPSDENIRRVRAVGRKRWKEEIGYHRRSLAETTLFRLKTIFRDHLQSRLFENQATEMFIRCRVLNEMNELAKPEIIKIEAAL